MWRVALSLAAVGAEPSDRLFIAKGKMAMRCSGIVMKEVEVRCCRMEGCCVSAK